MIMTVLNKMDFKLTMRTQACIIIVSGVNALAIIRNAVNSYFQYTFIFGEV